MVLTMDVAEVGSGDNRSTSMKSAISHGGVDLQIVPPSSMQSCDVTKKILKLDLCQQNEKGSIDEDEKSYPKDLKSPKSPLSNISRNSNRSSTVTHQSSITSQIDVVEDRKALRDALYQGIFHRHRRTIFAVGSFLRMLRTRSQYNTIRSSSEGEDDTR